MFASPPAPEVTCLGVACLRARPISSRQARPGPLLLLCVRSRARTCGAWRGQRRAAYARTACDEGVCILCCHPPDQRAPAQMVEFPVQKLVLLLALASAAHAAVDAQDRRDVSSPVDNQLQTESTALNTTQEVAAATPCPAAVRVPPDPPACRSRA